MASKNKTDSNIIFVSQDDPRSAELLRAALDTSAGLPVLGLVVKVKEDQAGAEEVVNFMFTDAATIRQLALVVPDKK
jgi:hypothetical protein